MTATEGAYPMDARARKFIGGQLDQLGLKTFALALLAPWDVFKLVAGALLFQATGRTPVTSYQAMVRLFCTTRGWSSDLIGSWVSRFHPPYAIDRPAGVLGNLEGPALEAITRDLDQNGFHIFEKRLPAELCDRLSRFAKTQPSTVRSHEPGSARTVAKVSVYDPNRPLGVRYDFNAEDLVAQPELRELVTDLSILAVAQSYLRCAPILDIVAMWWHTTFSKEANAEAAQLYHFDMDRLKWLKFFFYLTDVTPETGPHCFVAGSHRRGAIPRRLLKKGYSRLTDDEVAAQFAPSAMKEFCGPKGTIIAEDTRGLHKGQVCHSGDRLVFQLEFCNSLFGTAYRPIPLKPEVGLTARRREFPRVFSMFGPDPQDRKP